MSERDNHISYEVRDGVALIGIDRAAKRNAMNQGMFEALGRAAARAQNEARVGIIHSHGPNFSAGLDLAEHLERDPLASMHESRAQHAILNVIEQGRIPFIAALSGATIGAGLEIAASAHLRVGDETTFFALPEGKRGIFVGGGGSVRISRLIGVARMMEMMLTARTLAAAEGAACNLLQFTTPPGGALEKALELAAGIAKNSAVSNFAIINGLPRLRDASHDDGLFFESVLAAITLASPDAQAGLREFLEKRAARLAPSN
ncbi:crotonase/enoyl-CoA hydratase family protein [Variovorax paradoxus]|uniref:Crotonase/enoyl-CoA hydratase family protein n=1 Tax=Variovorax paradoxus TaxID=34073 RepID=A0A5Q0M9Q8_VARPD|nr:crotonase/enoyl-CoA hydratase family protein [Variovorax paradoxus]QFZ85162.1 crotonase/enoyl-CoA hydratase family protein [Variovorax paradoxus]